VRIGLVSDTHGLADPRLPELLAGCARILHAGDVGRESVLAALGAIAPLTAIRGNCDEGTSLGRLPPTALVPLGPVKALVVHDLGPRERPIPPARALLARERPKLVVHGHSHRPGAAVLDGTLFVNPGSAGPQRFRLPRAAAVLTLGGRAALVEWFDLAARNPTLLLARFEAEL
jgi:putative phosphoesterase